MASSDKAGERASRRLGMAKRLSAERRRLGFRQNEFAERVGTTASTQNFYESGRRTLRRDYLVRIGAEGVDITYVLTGRRKAPLMAGRTQAFVIACNALPPETQEELLALLRELGGTKP